MIEFVERDSSRTFYVVFDKFRGNKMFWNYFTRNNFDHVFLLTSVNNQCLAITPTPSECLIDVWPCTIEEAISWLPKDTTAIVPYTAKYNGLKLWKCRGIITCVSWAKYLLGINSWAITPWQLYKVLNGK